MSGPQLELVAEPSGGYTTVKKLISIDSALVNQDFPIIVDACEHFYCTRGSVSLL